MSAVIEIGGTVLLTALVYKLYNRWRRSQYDAENCENECTFVLTSNETKLIPIILESKSSGDRNLQILYAELDGQDITQQMQEFCGDTQTIIFQPDKELFQKLTNFSGDEWTKLLIRYK